MKLKAFGAVAAGIGLMALAVAAPAQADTNTGNLTTLAGVGSDTTQDVVEGFSNAFTSGGNPVLSNYKATPAGGSISTRTGNALCTFTRPNGSGAGMNALSDAISARANGGSANISGCVDFARSSSGSNPSTPPSADGAGVQRTLTYIPYATDAVTYATLTVSNVPKNLPLDTLKDIYTRNTGNCLYSPLIPQAGSGTRKFFATTVLGLANDTIGAVGGPGTCVKDVKADGVSIVEEHDGRALTTADQLVAFSVAQYISQAGGVISDLRGRASLGSVDFPLGADGSTATSPFLLQTSFGVGARPVYNVVSTNGIASGDPTYKQALVDTFVGAGSRVCVATSLIQKYGFATRGDCGSVTKRNTNSPGTPQP